MIFHIALGMLAALCVGLGAAASETIPDYVTAAVADPNRPETDAKRDAGRKPAELVAFAGVKPGDKVIELDPGPLYFTPPEPRYRNVTFVYEPIAKVHAPEAADLVWTTDNIHDFHNKLFGPADMTAVSTAIYRALKPGGFYIVADHAAAAGSGQRDTETLHRIDPAQVKAEALAAGFVLVGESQLLRNPADDHSKRVFDSSIRGVTDQFILKFQKPGGRTR